MMKKFIDTYIKIAPAVGFQIEQMTRDEDNHRNIMWVKFTWKNRLLMLVAGKLFISLND
jgi:hypothetical protein